MTHTKKYLWLLFDADGTLFDYNLAESRALENTFRDFSLPFGPHAMQLYRAFNHEVWADFERGRISAEALRVVRFERLFAALRAEAEAAASSGAGSGLLAHEDRLAEVSRTAEVSCTAEISRRYLSHLSQASDLLDGAEQVVRALGARYRLAMITNGLKEVQRPRLTLSSISGCFEYLAISEELGYAKPDPRYFDILFDQIDHPAKESVLVIGDSLSSDIQGGLNYGLDTCWFNPASVPANPLVPATYEIAHLSQLQKLLL